ncbi:hypothetical protein [Blastomonas sp.]|uniref:hypothetical protein n=1 Tax=Blastomonas sp. TaxID=1909299 RepID=UPI00391CBB70
MTNSPEATMAEGDWQVRARQRRRKLYAVIGVLFGMGLVSGFLIGFFEDDQSGFMAGGSIPPAVAIFAAVMLGIAITYGGLRFHRSSDELERRNMVFAAAMAGNVALAGYPLWFILWKGGLVPEPDALVLFGAAYAANLIAYFWYKFR